MSVRLPAWLRNAEQPRPLLTVGAIFLGALLTTLQGRLFSAALPDLRGHFGLDVLQAAGLGTALNAAQLLTMPVVPWLATVAGPARVLLWPSLALGGLGWLIPLAQHHYPALLVMHAMAGLCLGVYLPLTISLALRSLRPQWWLLIMAAYSLRVSAGMDAGLGASALLVEEFDWRAIYWTAGVAGPLLAWLTWKALPWGEVDRQRLDQADWAGMAMFCLGLVLLFVGVEGAERLGWQDSGLVVACLAGGGALFVLAIWRAAGQQARFGTLVPLGSRNIGLCLAIACLFGILMTPTAFLVPNFLAQMGALKPMQTSTATLTAFAAYVAATPLAIYLGRRLEPRLMMVAGLSLIALSAWWGTQLSHDWRADQFTGLLMLQSLGESIMLLGLIAAFVTNLNPAHGVALGAYVPIARVLTPVLAGTVMATWLRMSGDAGYAALAAHVMAGEPVAGARGTADPGALARMLLRESQVLAHIDGFHLVFWTSVLALVLAACLKSSPPNPIAPPRLP